MILVHGSEGFFDELSPEIAALVCSRIAQDFLGHSADLWISLQPHPNRQAKTMFLLFENGLRK